MTDREKDYIIARAIHQVCDPENPMFRWWDVPKYGTALGAGKILEYVMRHPNAKFSKAFKGLADKLIYPAIQPFAWHLTPGVIKETAYQAVRECMA